MYDDDECSIRINDTERVNIFLQVLANPKLCSSFTDNELYIMKETVTRYTKALANQLKYYYGAIKENVIENEVRDFKQK